MIHDICFTAEWLEKKRKELKGVDPSLLERALHAFALLGHLAESDLKAISPEAFYYWRQAAEIQGRL